MNEKVTIFCLTYNHKDYIADAIEGFLKQKTTFPYRVLIYDDASTDGTQDIIRRYLIDYPNIITAILSETNWYSKAKCFHTKIVQITEPFIMGQYIAWCEGDDYWTDEYKLEKQINYIDCHPGCSMCAHASMWLDCNTGILKEYRPYDTSRVLTEEEVLLQPNGNLSTASLLYRREIWFRDDAFPKADVEDVLLQWYAVLKGYVYYFNEIMSVYRYSHEGSWTSDVIKNKDKYYIHSFKMLNFLNEFNRYTQEQYCNYIKKMTLPYVNIALQVYSDYLSISRRLPPLDNDYRVYEKEIERLYIVIFKGELLNNDQKRIIKEKRHVVIYGCGDYARKVENYFDANGIIWDGNVISDDVTNMRSFDQKCIWNISEYPYEKADSCVVVGVSQLHQIDISRTLTKFNGFEVITPFWYEMPRF